jgi:hypothetical protein
LQVKGLRGRGRERYCGRQRRRGEDRAQQ